MRAFGTIALLAVLIPGCGSAPHQTIRSRHVILSTTPEGSIEDRAVVDYVEDRHGTLIRFTDLARDLPQLRLELQRAQPTFVTMILRADQLTTNNVFAFYEAAASLDPDPFADFCYGFVPYDSPATLVQWVKAVKIFDFRRERVLIGAAIYEGAGENSSRKETIPWASNLPVTTLRVKPDDVAFVKAHNTDLELANLLLLNGPAKPALELKMESQVVVSALPLFPAHDADPNLPTSIKLATALINRGAVAILGQMEGDAATVARAEFDRCAACTGTLGAVVKGTWDAAILTLGGKATLPRFEKGKPDPADWTRHPRELAAMSRILIGDPSMEPFTRASSAPVTLLNSFEKIEGNGTTTTIARVAVTTPDLSSAFLDPYTLDNGVFADGIHLVIELPPTTHEAVADLASSELDSVGVAAHVNAQAFESLEEKAFMHVLVGGAPDSFRRKNLTFTINIRRK